MSERILKAIPIVALVVLLAWAIWKLAVPEIDLRQTVAQNVVMATQIAQLQQQVQNQNAAFAQIYQNAETRSAVQKHFPNLFQPVQPAAGNRTTAKK